MNGAFRFQFEWLFFRLDIQKYYLYISQKFISRKMLVCIKRTGVIHVYILFVPTLLATVSQNEVAGSEVREVGVIMEHRIGHINNRIQVWEGII
jgi:hypothetical protein